MKHFALIKESQVVNLIVADDDFAALIAPFYDAIVDYTQRIDPIEIGWTFNPPIEFLPPVLSFLEKFAVTKQSMSAQIAWGDNCIQELRVLTADLPGDDGEILLGDSAQVCKLLQLGILKEAASLVPAIQDIPTFDLLYDLNDLQGPTVREYFIDLILQGVSL